MRKSISRYVFIFLVLALALLPFLGLAFYNHPSADDFCYTILVNAKGFWESQIFHYFNWSGRYLATALLTVNPIEHSSLAFYKLLPVFLFLTFALSIYLFLKTLLPKTDSLDILLLASMIFFLYVYQTPSIAEAFYWMSGSITYQLASILTLLLLTLVLHLKDQRNKLPKFWYSFFAGILCLAVVGLNETSLIILNGILFSSFLLDTYRNKQVDPILITLLIVTVAASAFSIFAPGNTERMSFKPDKFKPWFSISFSIKYTYYAILRWAPMTFILVLLWAGPLTRIGQDLQQRFSIRKFSLLHIIIFGSFLVFLMILCYFPSLWAQGGPPPDRTVNVIFLLYIFGVFGLASALLLYLKNTFLARILFSSPVQFSAAILGVAFVFLTRNNVRTVFNDLITGTAMRYDAEMEERYALLRQCTEATCIVPLLDNTPRTILAYDLATSSTSEEYYYNECLSDYFEKSSIMPRQE